MKFSSSLRPALLATLLIGLAVFATPALSAPNSQTNLLRNPDFESGTYAYNGDGARNIPNEWAPWWNGSVPPRYNPAEAPQRVKSGVRAASFWEEYRDYDGGLMQIIPNVTSGTVYRFTIWGHAWSTTDRSKTTSDTDVQMQIGIDPNGGGSGSASSIVWSGIISARDTYQLFSVEAAAKGNQITVWVRGKTTFPVMQTDFYWDTGSLTAVGQANPPTNAPGSAVPPTSAPGGGTTGGGCTSQSIPQGSIPQATPQPDGSIVHTVQRCETLIGIAVTYDVTLEDLRRLNNLSTDVLQPGQQLIIQGPQAPAPTATPEVQPATPTPAEVAEQPDGGDAGSTDAQPPEIEASGTICVMSYDDMNRNGTREPQEPLQAGITFLVTDSISSATTGTYTTDGQEDYHCFTELAPGNYTVTWTADSFTATNDQTWIANLAAGTTLPHEFGVAAANSSASGETNGERSDGLPPLVTAGIAALGIIFLLTGIGAAAYFFLARRASQIQ